MLLLSTEHVAKKGSSLRTISVIFLIVVAFVLLDVMMSSLVDLYRDFAASLTGISMFLLVTAVLVLGMFLILKKTNDQIKRLDGHGTLVNRLALVVWVTYYTSVAILFFVILQILLYSEYYTGLLSIASAISCGLAALLMGLLAFRFFAWFKRSKSLVVLLYGLASTLVSIYVVVLAMIFIVEIFGHQPTVTTLESGSVFPEIIPGFEEALIVTSPQILTAIIFLTFWGGTIAILYTNIRRLGKTKFWLLVTSPIIFFLGTLISLFPEIQGAAPADDPNSIIIPLYITTFSQVIAIGFFAIAFVSMARAIPKHKIGEYMYITCFGLTLFSIGIIATVSGAGYPPFGLPSVSLVGTFSFLLYHGLNHSALSAAQDSNLRRTIKVSAQQELKLLDKIGTAEMEQRLEKSVMEVTKLNADNLAKQTGIEPSLTMFEAKQYLFEVLNEEAKRKKRPINDNSGTV